MKSRSPAAKSANSGSSRRMRSATATTPSCRQRRQSPFTSRSPDLDLVRVLRQHAAAAPCRPRSRSSSASPVGARRRTRSRRSRRARTRSTNPPIRRIVEWRPSAPTTTSARTSNGSAPCRRPRTPTVAPLSSTRLRDAGAHPALEPRELAGLPRERLEKDRLRHPDGVGILGRDVAKVEPARRTPVDEEPAGGQVQVRLGEDVLEQPELVEEARRARLQDLAAELAVEGLVPLEHDHLGPALGQEQARAAVRRGRLPPRTRRLAKAPCRLLPSIV